MSAPRKPKALLDAEKRIITLEKELEAGYKSHSEQKEIIDGIHDLLDALGIKGWKDDSHYYRIPLTVRLMAWVMSSVKKPK